MRQELGIILAGGGNGSRFGGKNKLLESLDGVPVFIHSLRNFLPLAPPSQSVLVLPETVIPEFERALGKYLPEEPVTIIPGGDHRMGSVVNGLEAMPPEVEFVAVHDAARPLASPELLLQCLDACKKYGGGVAAKPVSDTVKLCNQNNFVLETVDRSSLWTVETPQVFPKKKLLAAYRKAIQDSLEFTDDAGIMENAGEPVFLVDNPAPNLKITYPRDLALAEFCLRKK